MAHMESLYSRYFLEGSYFRYDHFPYNFWSFFFRVPQMVAQFPYIKLPAYILQVRSVKIYPYFLINTNELTVSVFFLMPILMLACVPLFSSRFRGDEGFTRFAVLAGLWAVQILSVAFTVASIARYYYDFIPPMVLMAFIAAVHLRSKNKLSNGMIVFLGSLSLILSFALPMNALTFYAKFIRYPSPLLNIFF